MECSFGRVPAMAPASKRRVRRPVAAAFATAAFATAAFWLATARADDLLDRGVNFHIPASPLATALVEFSTQSGAQVAAADSDVSHVNSNGVNGTMPIRAALSMLLHGTGLEFSRIGDETIAIRNMPGGPAAGSLARAGASGSAVKTPAAEPAPSDPDMNAGALPDIPDVTVTAPRPPTDGELAGDSLANFVAHHATTHYVNNNTTGNLAFWRGGKQSICPLTVGLSPGYNAFVTARLRALAAYVGAPVQTDPQCKANVQVIFTNNPKEKMDDVTKWAATYFRNRYTGGTKDLIKFRSDHAIQGWYMTTSGGAAVLNTDVTLVGLSLLPVWPEITQHYVANGTIGTRLGAGSGGGSGIGIVILIVDTTKVAGATIGTISDYLAMLTMSVAQSPDNCDPLPSILDLMSSTCSAREMPKAVTAGDLAFLKGLYYRNTGLGASMSRAEIQANMMQQFKGR
jgi:secretin/TonB-like protein